MASEPRVSLVCFGLIGTLVVDEGLVQQSFAESIATQGIVSGTGAYARRMTQVHRARGRAPGDVFRELFPDNEARAQAAELAFDQSLAGALARTVSRPVPGAKEVLDGLAAAGYRLGVMTTHSGRVLDGVLDAVRWPDVFDVALSADDVPRGCPAPDYALTAMLRVGVADVREFAMVHGTGAGVECARRAGASVAVGVLTGPHSVARLRSAGATHIIDSVAELPALLAPALRAGPRDTEGSDVERASGRAGNGTAAPAFAVPIGTSSQAPLERGSGASLDV
jgi:phosphoglycolate phosphatase